jgi:polysaccharide export outer membrane protein
MARGRRSHRPPRRPPRMLRFWSRAAPEHAGWGREMRRVALTMFGLGLGLSGCSTLPHDGPSNGAILAAQASGPTYHVVELDARTAQAALSAPRRELASLAVIAPGVPFGRIGVGDGLAISIYEPSAGSLFSTTGEGTGTRSSGNNLPRLTVDAQGDVRLPFGGTVKVAGLTASQAARAVEASLRGKSVNPQVIVSIPENISNSVTVVGDVRNAGRYPLGDGTDRLLDALALAGGATKPNADVVVTLRRNGISATIPLDVLLRDPTENIQLAPRDQMQVVYRPRKFDTFGAFGRSAQFPIEDETLTLAGAMGRAGGLDPTTANASSVFLFRFERPEVAAALGVTDLPAANGTPIIYHLNLRKPEGFFVANSVEVKSGDLLYVPRSDSTEYRKFIDLVVATTQVAYNVRVTALQR